MMMIKKILLLTMLICNCVAVSAQQKDSIRINGIYLSNGMWRFDVAQVQRFTPLQFKVVAHGPITHMNGIMRDQRFKMALPTSITPGVYRIFPGTTDIIVDGKEMEISYTSHSENKDSVTVVFDKSAENGLYQGFLEENKARLKIIDALEAQYKNNKSEQLKKEIMQERKSYESAFDNFCSKHEGTWAALLVKNTPHVFAPLDLDEKQTLNYMHQHHFDGVDTHNPALTNTPLYLGVIENYLFYYFNKQLNIVPEAIGDSLVHAADVILAHFEGDDDCKTFAVKHLEAMFMAMGQEKPLHFVDTFYAEYLGMAEQCTDEDEKNLQEQFRMRLERDKVISEGMPVPNISVMDSDGKKKSLKDIADDTLLLMFWQQGCSHCDEQMPLVEQYLTKNPNKIKVVAISITPEDERYTAITKKYPHIVFMCDTKVGEGKYDREATKKFFVTGTPSYFLLDKDRNFIGSYYSWELVEHKLK